MAAPPLGARLQRDLLLDAAAIRAGAEAVGDMNPLHHDETAAAASRYGELIASGAYTAALLAGLLSSGFNDQANDGSGQVGVDYQVRFRGPVRVNRLMRMEWVVSALEERRSGVLAHMTGQIVDTIDGSVVLSAELRVLYFTPKPPC